MSKEAIDKGHKQFLAAMRAGDAAAMVALLTDGVRFYPPHEPTRKGRRAVKVWAEQLFNQVKTRRVSVSDREVVVAGDWAFERGAFVWAVAPVRGGETTEDRGRFLAIWRRQADGYWKVAHDIWNSSSPAPKT